MTLKLKPTLNLNESDPRTRGKVANECSMYD